MAEDERAQHDVPDDLLDGLEGQQRERRLELLRWLRQRDVGVEALRQAISDGRLALLPTEVILQRDCRYTLNDAADRSGLSVEFITDSWRAAGIAIPDADEPALDEDDLRAVELAGQVLEAGLPEDAYIDISRVVGRGAEPTAEALVQVSIERFLEPAQGEEAFAMRLQEIAEQLTPLLPFLLAFPVRMHLRTAVRNHALERRSEGAMALSGTREMAIGFADLVGFTALTQNLSLAESGGLATRLEHLATTAAEPPVRVVKLIGDAAMLASDDAVALVDALLNLLETAAREDDFPELRVGAASGHVAARLGDVYGPAVNLASRLGDQARPGQLLCSPELADALPEAFATERHTALELKGIGRYEPVAVTRA